MNIGEVKTIAKSAVADRPEGPWTDPIGRPLIPGNWGYIDSSVIIDDDRQAYLLWGNNGCWYAKLKAEYPQLTFINTLGEYPWEMNGTEGGDMVDPHWYVDPAFFFLHNNEFDNRARGKWKVYVGEYACNSRVGSGNMMAALADASFILGMERNGDLVKMASYAPLLTNVNQPNWSCNLIHFDTDRIMGRASYYVLVYYKHPIQAVLHTIKRG